MAIHGLLLIDKQPGPTSHDVVGEVRARLGQKAVGHAGTLDPMASGLLVLLLGEATKVSNYVLGEDKGYEVTVRLGVETDSWDTTGRVLVEKPVSVSSDDIVESLKQMSGDIELPVPSFSAVKVDGHKLYELAREGVEVQTPSRTMRFYDLDLKSIESNLVHLNLKCSKGGYVRSWAHELGRRLGCGAAVNRLRRNLSHPYRLEQAVTLSDLNEKTLEKGFIPLSEVLPEWPAVFVEGMDRKLLLNGQISHGLMGRLRPYGSKYRSLGLGLKVKGLSDQNLLALLHPNELGNFAITRVFNT